MHSFDFLSNSPKFLIFQRNSNKTNLGGVLFIIYIIIILCISFVYLYDFLTDFSSDNKYEVQSIVEVLIDEKRVEELRAVSETKYCFKF